MDDGGIAKETEKALFSPPLPNPPPAVHHLAHSFHSLTSSSTCPGRTMPEMSSRRTFFRPFLRRSFTRYLRGGKTRRRQARRCRGDESRNIRRIISGENPTLHCLFHPIGVCHIKLSRQEYKHCFLPLIRHSRNVPKANSSGRSNTTRSCPEAVSVF